MLRAFGELGWTNPDEVARINSPEPQWPLSPLDDDLPDGQTKGVCDDDP